MLQLDVRLPDILLDYLTHGLQIRTSHETLYYSVLFYWRRLKTKYPDSVNE